MAGIAIGAAVALGTYFIGKEMGEEEAKQKYQNRVDYAKNMTPTTDKNSSKCDDDGDEKISSYCTICMTSFNHLVSKGVEIHSTPCGHIFCKACIDSALEINNRCPNCNVDIELLPGQTKRIYL